MSDVRALLLTDVVDSTQLAATIGDDAMAQAWAAHDRVARDLLQAHGGREIDKTDGMLLMFDAAAAALAFADAYHQALAALPRPLTARAGLHVGPVILRENSAADVARGAKPVEVDGLAKPTAARIMSLARGGQTLLTAEARDALHGSGLAIHSHGHWMVKGVAEPVEIFEAPAPLDDSEAGRACALADSDKAYRVVRTAEWWLPVRDIPHNLPHQSTSFVGREADIAAAKSLLEHTRLLTLLGMGGLGKTRLGLRLAADVLHLYPDGVWFVDLAPLRDDALVVAEAAQVIGVKAEPDRSMLQSICAHLKPRRALIVLDNCEHLLKPAAELANAVLKAAPFVRIIASSREALHLPGEQAYPVNPLPLPVRDARAAELLQSPAARLFIERAQQQKPSFTADAAHAPAVAELVTRLEGIPLALELAAARVRVLTVNEINARLKDRYRILTGGARVLQERQQTLRALVDWSHDLLSEPEQVLFRRLGVFVGGFDLAAAEEICGFAPLEAGDILDLLGSLVEKSLVLLAESDDGGRYRMLETIRDYARERLELAAEDGAAATRHCDCFFALAKRARDGMNGPDQAEWMQALEADLDNVRAAMSLALARGADPLIAVKMAVALQRFWTLRGYTNEGRQRVREALALPEVQASDVAQAWALYVGAAMAELQSDHVEARAMLEQCLALRRRRGNPVEIAATLSTLSLPLLRTGDPQAAAASETEALAIFRANGDVYGEALGLLHLGQISTYIEDAHAAREQLQQCLMLARTLKNQEIEGECELALGEVALGAGDRSTAEAHFKRSLTVCRDAADRRGEANALLWLGKCDLAAGALPAARARLTQALTAFQAHQMWAELLEGLEDFAELAAAEGDVERAVQLAAATTRARERLKLSLSPRAGRRYTELATLWLQALRNEDYERCGREGGGWDVEAAVRHALSRAEDAVAR